jgi:hypothetical protein
MSPFDIAACSLYTTIIDACLHVDLMKGFESPGSGSKSAEKDMNHIDDVTEFDWCNWAIVYDYYPASSSSPWSSSGAAFTSSAHHTFM